MLYLTLCFHLMFFVTVLANNVTVTEDNGHSQSANNNSNDEIRNFDYKSLINSAINLISQNKFHEAEEVLNNSVDLKILTTSNLQSSDKVDVLILFCIVKILQKDFKVAESTLIQLYKSIVQKDILEYTYYLLSEIYYQTNRFKESIECLKKIYSSNEEAKYISDKILAKIITNSYNEEIIDEILSIEDLSIYSKNLCSNAKKNFQEIYAFINQEAKYKYSNIISQQFETKNNKNIIYKVGIFYYIDKNNKKNYAIKNLHVLKAFVKSLKEKYANYKEVEFIFINSGNNFKETKEIICETARLMLDCIIIFENEVLGSNHLISQYAEQNKIPIFNFENNTFIDDNPYYRIIHPSPSTISNAVVEFSKLFIDKNKNISVLRIENDDYSLLADECVQNLLKNGFNNVDYFIFQGGELSTLINLFITKYKGKISQIDNKYKKIIDSDYIFIISKSEFLTNCIISLLKIQKHKPEIVIIGDIINYNSVSIDQIVDIEPYIISHIDLTSYHEYNQTVRKKISESINFELKDSDLNSYFGLDLIYQSLFNYENSFLKELNSTNKFQNSLKPNFCYNNYRDPQDFYIYKINKISKNNFTLSAIACLN